MDGLFQNQKNNGGLRGTPIIPFMETPIWRSKFLAGWWFLVIPVPLRGHQARHQCHTSSAVPAAAACFCGGRFRLSAWSSPGLAFQVAA